MDPSSMWLWLKLASSVLLLECGRAFGVLSMPAERAGRRKLTETVADHVLGHVDRDVLLAVIDGNCVHDKIGKDYGRTRPGLDDLLLVALFHRLDAAEEPRLDERSLLDRTRHASLSSALLDRKSNTSELQSRQYLVCRLLLE